MCAYMICCFQCRDVYPLQMYDKHIKSCKAERNKVAECPAILTTSMSNIKLDQGLNREVPVDVEVVDHPLSHRPTT